MKDKDAFGELYDIYIDKIYRFVYFKVSSSAEAEDLTSQIFLKVWQLILDNKIKTGQSFQAFLYTLARNTVIDFYRHSRKEKGDISLEEAADISAAGEIEKEIDIKIEMERLSLKLKKLKSEYREALVLHYINELSIKEIAEILNKKRGAVRVLLHRAVNSLKEILK